VARRLMLHSFKKAANGCTVKVMGEGASDVQRFEEEALNGADILVLDQNLVYPNGTVFGTDIVRRLLNSGYNGFIAIRSANDTEEDHKIFFTSGAHVVLGKDVPAKDMIARLRLSHQKFLMGSARPPLPEPTAYKPCASSYSPSPRIAPTIGLTTESFIPHSDHYASLSLDSLTSLVPYSQRIRSLPHVYNSDV
jgi:DNA-binding NarL/FixJ family response regulator